jgi:hypothetical protein
MKFLYLSNNRGPVRAAPISILGMFDAFQALGNDWLRGLAALTKPPAIRFALEHVI